MLCEGLEELPLLFVVSSHKLFMELLKEEERKLLVEQMRKRSATINLSAKPLPSFYDIPGEISSVACAQLKKKKKTTQKDFTESDLVVVLFPFTSISQREHRAAGAAAHPPAGTEENQANLDRTARHGRTTFLEDQQ